MTSQAIEKNEIVIDGNHYRTTGPVQMGMASRRPGKITFGEITSASNPQVSELSQGDFRDGIGVERGDLPEDLMRVWWSTAQLRYKDATILPRRAILTAAGPDSPVDTLSIFKNEIYGTYATDVRVYDNSVDTWGSSLRTLADAATDSKVGLVGGVETLILANGTDVDYATDSSTWAENTGKAIKYLVFWSDLLWGITNAGQLYYTNDLATAWSSDALLQLPAGSISGMIVGRGPDREQHIYAVTNQGLYVHDADNARFILTDLELPVHPDGGRGKTVWRGKIFISAGNAVYGFQAGSDQTIVAVVGPDKDHGMPSDKRGVIKSLIGSHNELLAFMDASVAAGISGLQTRVSRGVGFHHGATFSSQTGFSSILGWNERSWEVEWLSSASSKGITAGVVGNAYTAYRLWWAANQRVYYMTLPVDVVNPLQVTGSEYDSSATLETPWNDMQMSNWRKLALSVIVETINPTSSETVKVEYATNFDETYTTVGTCDTTGEKTFRLPDSVSRKGVPFRAWKWRITFSRGTTVTNTPQLVKITLVWRPRVETLYGIGANLDMRDSYGGLTPVDQFRNIRSSLNKDGLIEVSFHADKSGKQTYLVDLDDLQTNEDAGQDSYGTARVFFIEPVSSDIDRTVV